MALWVVSFEACVGRRTLPSSQSKLMEVIWLCLSRGLSNFLAQSFYPRSVILTMGRRNRPKQGDPKPLFEDQPSSSKISKRKADDEGRQKNTKKVKPNDSKGKGRQVFARGGLKERKRTKMATPAADDYEDEYSDMDA